MDSGKDFRATRRQLASALVANGDVGVVVEVKVDRVADGLVNQMKPAVIAVQRGAKRHLRRLGRTYRCIGLVSDITSHAPASVWINLVRTEGVWLFLVWAADLETALENGLVDEAAFPVFGSKLHCD